jgi:DNA-binding response OmpR family regulator
MTTGRPYRILLLEDDFLLAHFIAAEIREQGSEVIGPFPDPDAALTHIRLADAAILDVRLGEATAFGVADFLSAHDTPYVFYTGCDPRALPPRFQRVEVVVKPSSPVHLLHRLRNSGKRSVVEPPDLTEILHELRAYARYYMPDPQSADRLVAAALERAIQNSSGDGIPADARQWLLDLLKDEHRARCGRHMS